MRAAWRQPQSSLGTRSTAALPRTATTVPHTITHQVTGLYAVNSTLATWRGYLRVGLVEFTALHCFDLVEVSFEQFQVLIHGVVSDPNPRVAGRHWHGYGDGCRS